MEMTFRPAVSKQIMFTTVLASVILLGVGMLMLFLTYQNRQRGPVRFVLLFSAITTLFFLVGSTAFRIRSYDIASGNFLVKLGIGQKVFPLAGLQEVRVIDYPFSGARRVMGIGGLWSMYGSFSSSKLGDFSAYASSTTGAVLLTWPDKKVIVTPENPTAFAQSVRAAK